MYSSRLNAIRTRSGGRRLAFPDTKTCCVSLSAKVVIRARILTSHVTLVKNHIGGLHRPEAEGIRAQPPASPVAQLCVGPSTKNLNFYTVILDYRGGTYILQVKASDFLAALRIWSKGSPRTKIKGLPRKEIRSLLKDFDGEVPVPLDDSLNVWCATGMPGGHVGLFHIVKSSRAKQENILKKAIHLKSASLFCHAQPDGFSRPRSPLRTSRGA